MPVIDLPTSDQLLLCPGCGYDLRASTDGRCSECGLAVDFASLRVSAFPWAHCQEMGRVRGYVRTVWQVLVGSRALAHETVKPQDPADARSFARVTGTILAITLLIPFAAAVADAGGMGFLAVPANAPGAPWLSGWHQDLIVPWAAGVTLWPVTTLCLIFMGFYLARAGRPMFRVKSGPLVQADRAAAIALYTSAPLVLVSVAQVFFLAVVVFDKALGVMQTVPVLALVCVTLSAVVAAIGVVATLGRTGQWLARVQHGGVVTGFAGAAVLLVLWVAGAFVLLGILPWCLGFLWLVVDSLR